MRISLFIGQSAELNPEQAPGLISAIHKQPADALCGAISSAFAGMSRATDAIMAARIGPCTITRRSTTPGGKPGKPRWDCLYHAHPGSLLPLVRISLVRG